MAEITNLIPLWMIPFQVWYAAASQMFFSLNCGMSAIIMFSSYNRFDHNIYR